MFPNLRAEMARNGMTIKMLQEKLKEDGIEIALSTLTQKIGGKYEFNLSEADAIGRILNPAIPLRVLFSKRSTQ